MRKVHSAIANNSQDHSHLKDALTATGAGMAQAVDDLPDRLCLEQMNQKSKLLCFCESVNSSRRSSSIYIESPRTLFE